MGGFTLPLTHLHCSVAQLSKHFHTAPSASSHRELSYPGPIWPGSAGTPRSLWQRATSWLCLRIRFKEKRHSLLSRSCSNREGTLTHPRLSHKWPFPIFMGLKVSCSHKVSHPQNATWHYSRLATGQAQGRMVAQQGHQPCAPAAVAPTVPAAPSLPLQHLELAANWIFPLDENGGKALGHCVNSACRLELTPGHVTAAQRQLGLNQCSGSRQAARKIKVSRPIRDSVWHILLSTRINSTWNTSHCLGMDCPAALLPPTVFLPLDYLHVTYNKKHHAFLLIV